MQNSSIFHKITLKHGAFKQLPDSKDTVHYEMDHTQSYEPTQRLATDGQVPVPAIPEEMLQRSRKRGQAFPLSAVGQIFASFSNRQVNYGTGFMIGPNHVLTTS